MPTTLAWHKLASPLWVTANVKGHRATLACLTSNFHHTAFEKQISFTFLKNNNFIK